MLQRMSAQMLIGLVTDETLDGDAHVFSRSAFVESERATSLAFGPSTFVTVGSFDLVYDKLIGVSQAVLGFLSVQTLTFYPIRVKVADEKKLHGMMCRNCMKARTMGLEQVRQKSSVQEFVLSPRIAEIVSICAPMFCDARHHFLPGIEINLVDYSSRVISLLPLPNCNLCMRSLELLGGHERHDLTRLIPSLVHWPGGIVKGLSVNRPVILDREAPMWIAKALTTVFPNGKEVTGSGRGFSMQDAVSGALGEVLESYAAFSDFGTTKKNSKQVKVSSESISNGRKSEINVITTSGIAVHTELRRAVESSYRELIERDSFLIGWHTGIYRGCFNLLTHPDMPTRTLAEFLNELGFNICCVELPTDFKLRVVQVVLWHAQPSLQLPYTVCGLGTGSTLNQATMRALLEATQMIPTVTQYSKTFRESNLDTWGPSEHGGYYGSKLRLQELRHLLKSESVRPFSPIEKDLSNDDKFFCEELDGTSSEARVQIMGTEDLHALGVSCVRLEIPGLVQLYFGRGPRMDCFQSRCAAVLTLDERAQLPWDFLENDRPHPLT